MLGGIGVAGYTLPDSTPLKTFVISSAAIFLLGNILLILRLRRNSYAAGSERGPYRMTTSAWIAISFFVLYWILTALWR